MRYRAEDTFDSAESHFQPQKHSWWQKTDISCVFRWRTWQIMRSLPMRAAIRCLNGKCGVKILFESDSKTAHIRIVKLLNSIYFARVDHKSFKFIYEGHIPHSPIIIRSKNQYVGLIDWKGILENDFPCGTTSIHSLTSQRTTLLIINKK